MKLLAYWVGDEQELNENARPFEVFKKPADRIGRIIQLYNLEVYELDIETEFQIMAHDEAIEYFRLQSIKQLEFEEELKQEIRNETDG